MAMNDSHSPNMKQTLMRMGLLFAVSAAILAATGGVRALTGVPIMLVAQLAAVGLLFFGAPFWFGVPVLFLEIAGETVLVFIAPVARSYFWVWMLTGFCMLIIWSDVFADWAARYVANHARVEGESRVGRIRRSLKRALPGIALAAVFGAIYGFAVPVKLGEPIGKLAANAAIAVGIGLLCALAGRRFRLWACYLVAFVSSGFLTDSGATRLAFIFYVVFAGYVVGVVCGDNYIPEIRSRSRQGAPSSHPVSPPAPAITSPQHAMPATFSTGEAARSYAAAVPQLELAEVVVAVDPTTEELKSLFGKKSAYCLSWVSFTTATEQTRIPIWSFSGSTSGGGKLLTDPGHARIGEDPYLSGSDYPGLPASLRENHDLPPMYLALMERRSDRVIATIRDTEVPLFVDWLNRYAL